MKTELTTAERVRRGRRAQEIIDDPVFHAALEAARETINENWLAAQTVVEREACWAKSHALDVVVDELRIVVNDGAIAASAGDDE